MLRVCVGRSVELQTASDAAQLVTLASRHRPGLLVVDYRLPGRGDGIETLRAVRSTPGIGVVPALVVAQRVEADFVRSRLLVATGVLVRPVERVALSNAIRDLVPRAA
jgi:CheY-like chemotaxis protein